MSNSNTGRSITQYGVQTPNSSTVLIVTTDRAEADQALDWITDGRVVHRTITYGGWQPGTDDGDLALVGVPPIELSAIAEAPGRLPQSHRIRFGRRPA